MVEMYCGRFDETMGTQKRFGRTLSPNNGGKQSEDFLQTFNR